MMRRAARWTCRGPMTGSLRSASIARRRAADAPQRTVGAAKSWLCHSRVDRRQPILPWNAPSEVPKISPVTAARHYLDHLVAAWEAEHPEAPVSEQRVVLTVPASFDAAARELTREAALAAGLPPDLILLEEPQAAVYAWLAAQGDRWRKLLHVGDRLLVCDVGGGTTDLTLIEVTRVRRRTAVAATGGRRPSAGGRRQHGPGARLSCRPNGLPPAGHQLDPWQTVSLWHACRNAKETMLATDGPETHAISVLGRGSKLIGGTVSVEIDRDTVARNCWWTVSFRAVRLGDRPQRRGSVGLPRNRPAVRTGHGDHAAPGRVPHGPRDRSRRGVPTHVLVQRRRVQSRGTAATIARRAGQLDGQADARRNCSRANTTWITRWRAARAHYGWTKQRGGVRIRGGVARSYYIGIETAGLAIPGAPRPLRALCVVPFGMEEGTQVDVPSSDIGLVLGEPAHFRFFSSAVRKDDQPGTVLDRWTEQELVETDSLETVLPADAAIDEPYVPVRFQSRITELGMFELWCVSTQSDGRWKLEFSVRDEGGTG